MLVHVVYTQNIHLIVIGFTNQRPLGVGKGNNDSFCLVDRSVLYEQAFRVYNIEYLSTRLQVDTIPIVYISLCISTGETVFPIDSFQSFVGERLAVTFR